jgi:hypothetical protein
MDEETHAPAPQPDSNDGTYLRRAQALMAARAELFAALPSNVPRFAGIAVARRERVTSRNRPGGRQLSLPLPRERLRRQARMLR